MGTFSTSLISPKIKKIISLKPMLLSPEDQAEAGDQINLVGVDPLAGLVSDANKPFSPRLLNWVEPYIIQGSLSNTQAAGVTYTLFYTEVNHNLSVGDRVFIINGNYDSDLLIKSDKYKKGRDGYKVLFVDKCKIVLDIPYNGTIPYESQSADDFINIFYIRNEQDFKHANRFITTKGGNFDNKFSYYKNNVIYADQNYSAFAGWGENGGLTGSPGFYVKNGTFSWTNITSEFITGSFSLALAPGSTASRVKINNASFTFSIGPGIVEFEEGLIFKFDMAPEPDASAGTYSTWVTDVLYERPFITKGNFRGGNFKGTWNVGLFGRSDKKVTWEGDTSTFRNGTVLNTIWEKGKIDSVYTLPESFITEFDEYGIPNQKSTGPNNNGRGYNFIIDSDIISSTIVNGTIINSSIGSTTTYSVIENYYTSAGLDFNNDIIKAYFENCSFNGGNVSNSEIKNGRSNNTYFENIKSINSHFKNSVFKNSNYISDDVIKILDYDEFNYAEVSSIQDASHKVYKFYIEKKDYERLKIRDRFYVKGLNYNTTLNNPITIFDNRFRLSSYTDYVDAFNLGTSFPNTATYSFYKRGIEVAAYLSTPADNEYKYNTVITGSFSRDTYIVDSNNKKGYSLDIVVSKYDKNLVSVGDLDFNRSTNESFTYSLTMSNVLGNIIDVTKAYILDSDFESGLFENSDWNAGYHINYNNDVNITENSAIGKYYNINLSTASTIVATTTYDLNYRESGENCLTPGNVVYLNSVDYDTRGQIFSFTISTAGSSYSSSVGVTGIGGSGTGAIFEITATGGSVSSATLSNVGLGYEAGDILTLQSGNSNSFIIVTSVTGSIVRLPDTYKITQNLGNTIYLEELISGSTSVISGLTGGGLFYTTDAQNRYGYIYKAKFKKSKIKSGVFKRSYITESLIENQEFDTTDRDLTNNLNAKKLLIYESLFSNTSNILSKALYMNSYFIKGSDSYNNGIVSNSIWIGQTFSDGIFRQGRWVDGLFAKGLFYDSKSFNKTSTINNPYYESENIRSYYKDGMTSDVNFNNRNSWQNGTFSSGEILKSDWENGFIEYAKIVNSNFYNGKIKDALIGDDTLNYNVTNIIGGSISFATVENANLFAEDVSYYGLSGSSIDWYDGIFQNGVFGCDLDYIVDYKALWHNGIFNGGEFVTNGKWKTGTFNGGKFISGNGWTFSQTYDTLSNNKIEYTWEDGVFNGGEFGSAQLATNSCWYSGEFNGGTFKGRFWNDGLFTFGKFEGSATISSVGGASNSNASDFTDSFSQSFYGLWRNGFVTNIKDKFIVAEKIFTEATSLKKLFIKKPMSYIENALWLSGTFSHQRATMVNCVWLDGTFERGYFNSGSFNPFVKRPGDAQKSFNLNDDSCYWQNGEFKNGDFNISVWNDGKFVIGTAYGMIFKNGVSEYMNAFNVFWDNGLWRNGNWYGSSFQYNGIVEDPFVKDILDRGFQYSGNTSSHIWNLFDNTRNNNIIASASASTITTYVLPGMR